MEIKQRVATGLLALTASFALTYSALGEPITYTFTARGPITGTLDGVSIGGNDEIITFTFVSDTSDVVPFTFGDVHGYENLVGTGSVTVTNATTGSVIAHDDFLSSDKIFVSIDNKNGGVGFGSAGADPSSSAFPGNPAYPLGLPTDDSRVFTYDLKSNIIFNSSDALSCLGFPGTCTAPTELATTGGDLVFGAAGDPFSVVDNGEFVATTVPESSTWALMLAGFAGLGFASRARSRQRGLLSL
jgi:hypothetical protein